MEPRHERERARQAIARGRRAIARAAAALEQFRQGLARILAEAEERVVREAAAMVAAFQRQRAMGGDGA